MFKIADFGLLRHASKDNTETINIKGTPRYMAPEAMRGDLSVKVDVFSFGAVILEIITGLPSFDRTRENRDIVRFDSACKWNTTLITSLIFFSDYARQRVCGRG